MSGKLLVINPGPKGKRRLRGKMPAGLARYWAGKRKGRATKNPRRKSRARKNPRLGQLFSKANLKSHVLEPVVAAGIGGAAAVALDVGLAYLPFGIGDKLKNNALASNAVKLVGAVGLGFIAGKVLGKERGRLVTTGALTVAAYNAIRDGAKQVLPEEWRSKVRGLGGIADYVDYELDVSAPMGALQYTGGPLRAAGPPGGFGMIERSDALPMGGAFDPSFENSFSGMDD